jgi:hypothetical protein
MMTALSRSAPDRLRADFHGELISPGDGSYDAARRVWNGAIDRRPALIARIGGAADVVTALRFAGERGLPVSIRGGGHSAAGFFRLNNNIPPAAGPGSGNSHSEPVADGRRGDLPAAR